MNFIKSIIFLVISLIIFPICCFAEEPTIEIKERDTYNVQIKQYQKEYPIVLYVVFKEYTPLLEDIKKILKTEILTLTKTKQLKTNIIASAWFDDQVSEELHKIELTNKYGALVWINDDKEKKIVTFPEYIKYLKKKKEEDKNKQKEN